MEKKNTLLTVAALEWLSANTKLEVDPTHPECSLTLPAGAQVFIARFVQIMEDAGTVSSESIGGMSQSFHTGDRAALLLQLARALLGSNMVRSAVSFGHRCGRWM